MTPVGPIPPPFSVAASAAGSSSTGAVERTAKADAAAHSLAAGRRELSTRPLDAQANSSPDRDADGWTGGSAGDGEDAGRASTDSALPSPEPAASSPTLRLPDDPRGGRLDVTA